LPSKRLHSIKPEIRVLGVDDGTFVPHSKKLVPIIGVVYRGVYWLDGVISTHVKVDGFDATEKISSMILASSHHKQLRVVVLDGITFAGFNVVNIKKLNRETKLPIIAVTREKPNLKEIREALENLSRSEERWKAIKCAGKLFEVFSERGGKKIFMHISGISKEDARKILLLTAVRSSVPEALRVAHLIASGISKT
jgi:endonuclease V-like protein UPF0215 family